MTDGTGAQILQSFLDGDEELQATVTVEAVQRGFSTSPPMSGDDVTVGVTRDRLLWFDDELETVPLDEIERVEQSHIEHQSAPTIVRLGSFGLIFGILAAIGTAVATDYSLLVSIALVAGGALAFVATILVARSRDESGSQFEKHRLVVEGDAMVLIWGQQDALSAIESAIAERIESGDVATDQTETGQAG